MADSDDEDLKRAIAMSLMDPDKPEQVPVEETTKVLHGGSRNANPATTGIHGLGNRADMERDRLARLAVRRGGKRERSISPPPLSRVSKIARLDTVNRPSGPTQAANAPISPSYDGSSGARTPVSTAHLPAGMSFTHGKLFKTWAFKQPRTGHEIKIEEVLEKETLSTAVLSSFQWDFEWLFAKLRTKETKFHFVLDQKTGGRDLASDLESLGANVKTYVPSEGTCMHSKLMLLVHPTKLRVVVPSANMMSYDWGEDGIMENTVWLIDLPRRSSESEPSSTPFLEELKFFLGKQQLPLSVITGLNKFDWSATRPYAFVHTVAGSSFGTDMTRTGLTGLSSAVRGLNLCSTRSTVDMCASSVGALDWPQVVKLYAAACGDLQVPTTPTGLHKTLPNPSSSTGKDSFHLYFPTETYVDTSPGGKECGGTIWLNREHYERTGFPKQIMKEYKSTRGQLLSHCKMLFVRGLSCPPLPTTPNGSSATSSFFGKKKASVRNNEIEPPSKPIAYVYAGSANCSESAWGKLSVTRDGPHRGEVKIQCRNWECGVLIPVVGPNVKGAAPEEHLGGEKRLGKHRTTAVGHGNTAKGSDATDTAALTVAAPMATDDDETESEDGSTQDGIGNDEPVNGAEASRVTSAQWANGGMDKKIPDWSIFRTVIDGPFQYPADAIGSATPWFIKEYLNEKRRQRMDETAGV
ncbi:hypothetical protein CAC42_7610 [Sphaceloma murrayae]|uniref:Tyrosyl-DNA phosphodiesterase 1 n=1 Tax=Sphaceloma murrayae TaxID=2082308 RepID=A0A2K1QT76_9PEZI|nr:hypothetical protein CAC42_7610 [Sphaceloma murrayae]